MSKGGFFAKAEWDEEAGISYISDTNFPGLVAEAPTVEAIFAKIRALIPELLQDNAHLIDWEPGGDFPINLVTEQIEKIRIAR